MAIKVLPQTVADAFVKQYYVILNICPEKAHKFYREPSMLGWQGPDGVMTSITSLSGINDMIMSSAYKNCTMEIKSRDAQESLDGGIIIVVTGSLTGKDNVKKDFCQTFFLAKQEKGFYVLNDILRFIDVADVSANNDGIENQPAPSVQNSGVEDEKNKEAFDPSASEDTVAEGAETRSSIASGEKVHSPFGSASNENMPWTVVMASNKKARSAAKTSKKKVRSTIAPEVNEKVQSSVETVSNEEAQSILPPASNETVPSVEPASTESLPEVAAPASTGYVPAVVATTSTEKEPSAGALASDEKAHSAVVSASDGQVPSAVALDSNVPSVAAPASTVTKKITYASIVAKQAPAASPRRTIRVVTNVNKQQVPFPTAKVSTSASKDAPNFDSCAEATGIYIGGLPNNITKQGLIDVVKKFGPVRRKTDTVQIRRHVDGFCCGFVEFESADAARRAVEAHHVKFGETEAYIAYKRSYAYQGNEAGGRSPTNNRTNSNKAQSRHRRRGSRDIKMP